LAREYLFIIGNGFDLWHELATSYTEFYGLYADYLDAQQNYFPTQQLYGLEDAVLNFGEEFVKTITGHFTKWVKSINLTHAQIQIALPSGAQFISFNYTSTLQTVYQVPESNILHIHGAVAHNAGLVFGHSQAVMDSDRGEDTYYSDAINNGRQVLKDLKKPVDYVTANTLKPWLSNNNGFSKIIIIGHSLNEIDTPYFKTILNAFPNAYWECYSYSAHEASAHESKLLDIGVSQSLLKVGTYEKLLEAFPFE
jgi:hypothetical protein